MLPQSIADADNGNRYIRYSLDGLCRRRQKHFILKPEIRLDYFHVRVREV